MKNSIIYFIAAVMAFSNLYSCQNEEEQMLIELSAESAQGKDGFTYILTKNEFLTSFDIPVQQLQAKYGNDFGLADWNDLEANFGNDFSGLLEEIDLFDDENHEGIFITNDKEYLFVMTRPYMISGKIIDAFSAPKNLIFLFKNTILFKSNYIYRGCSHSNYNRQNSCFSVTKLRS